MSDEQRKADQVQRVWDAAFGAYFAAQVFGRMSEGGGAPDPWHYTAFREEAATVADEAVAALRKP